MDDFLNESIANGCGNVNSEINRIENNAEAEPIQCYSAADLDAGQFEVRYLVESVMVCGQPLILAGPKKCLKTSVAIDLALALATGGMFLGKFPVKHRSRVGFMSGESGLGTIQETARRICDAMGNSLSSVGDRLVFTEWLPMFDSTPDLGKLKHWIIDQSLDVVFVDPAYMAIPGEGAGNLFEMGRILRSASSVFGQTRSTMVLLHHTRKNTGAAYEQFTPPELEGMAWAGFQEFARQWVLLGRRERYEPGSGQHRLWMSSGGSAGHSGLWAVDVEEGAYEPGTPRVWHTTVQKAAEARRDVAARKEADNRAKAQRLLEDDIGKALKILSKCPEGETKTQIRDRGLIASKRVAPALEHLIDSGQITTCIVKKDGKKFTGYRLTAAI